MTRLRRRLTFANVTSCLALFIALGGTGYAATLASNSVGKRQIRTNGVGKSEIASGVVGTSEIATNAVRSAEVRRGAVGASEMRADSVRTSEIAANAVGASEIADGGIATADLATATKADLVPERAIVTSGGTVTGTTTNGTHTDGSGVYAVTFRRDVSTCAYSATPARVTVAGTQQVPDPGATATVESNGGAVVTVRTFAPAGGNAAATDMPFHLLVACGA